MEKYISKSAVVAEIERLRDLLPNANDCDYLQLEFARGQQDAYTDFEEFIRTLEVKEVDLKNELKEDWLFADKIEVDCLESMCLTEDMFASLAKKYFELGINTRKI